MVERAFIGPIGTTELVIILIIVLILFGAGRLPQVGSALGRAIRNFRDSTQNDSGAEANRSDRDTDQSSNS